MSRVLPVVLLLVAPSACALSTEAEPGTLAVEDTAGVAREAITGGWDDDGDPDVVALMNGSALTCTGTLIAHDLVLTAAHCVDGLPVDSVISGPDPAFPAQRSSVSTVTPHPTFDRATGQHDIAVVRISPGIEAPLRPLLFAPLYPGDVGAPVRFVGYGLSGDGRPLRKRLGVSAIASIAEQTFDIQGDSQPCRGDSGGPTLLRIEGVEVLAGVHSSGPGDCAGYATETRVDANAAFLGHFVGSTEYALGGPGGDLNSQCSAAAVGRRPRGAASLLMVVAALALAGLRTRRRADEGLRRAGSRARHGPRSALRASQALAAAAIAALASAAGCAEWDVGKRSASGGGAITMRDPPPDPGVAPPRDPDATTRDAGRPATPAPAPGPAPTPATPPPSPTPSHGACAPATIGCLETCADQTCADGCFAADPTCVECLGAAFDACVARNGCGPALDALDACIFESGCPDESCVSSGCAAELASAQACLPPGACAEDEAACLP
ncbi:MAG: S1 family peptidase [Deltaproteobacteria bacterium]|nr:S1 family peptidase [Deltaproteobacteria bacterium]